MTADAGARDRDRTGAAATTWHHAPPSWYEDPCRELLCHPDRRRSPSVAPARPTFCARPAPRSRSPPRGETRMRALVIESGQARAALAAVRGLAAGGWDVGVAVPERALSTASRRCSRWHR